MTGDRGDRCAELLFINFVIELEKNGIQYYFYRVQEF